MKYSYITHITHMLTPLQQFSTCTIMSWGDDQCTSVHDLIDPLFLHTKNSLYISHLVPEILGPKFALLFHQNVVFNGFKAFVSIFSLIFDPV